MERKEALKEHNVTLSKTALLSFLRPWKFVKYTLLHPVHSSSM